MNFKRKKFDKKMNMKLLPVIEMCFLYHANSQKRTQLEYINTMRS